MSPSDHMAHPSRPSHTCHTMKSVQKLLAKEAMRTVFTAKGGLKGAHSQGSLPLNQWSLLQLISNCVIWSNSTVMQPHSLLWELTLHSTLVTSVSQSLSINSFGAKSAKQNKTVHDRPSFHSPKA